MFVNKLRILYHVTGLQGNKCEDKGNDGRFLEILCN